MQKGTRCQVGGRQQPPLQGEVRSLGLVYRPAVADTRSSDSDSNGLCISNKLA